MKINDLLNEHGRIVKGVNTTVDVGVNQISIEASKFGNTVDKDGRPPTLSSKVKGSSTNVLYNLGMVKEDTEPRYTAREWAIMEGGHSLEDIKPSYRPLGGIMLELAAHDFKEALGDLNPNTEFYIDMDGVLADFFGEWARLMGVEHFTQINKKHNINDALQKIRDTENFWLKLPLLPQARELLQLVKKVKGSYNICSSPLADDPNSEPHKREWIKKNLSFFPPKNVYITHNKPQFATQADGTPNILIDDYGVNIDAWEAAGGIGFKHKDHKFERTAKAITQAMQQPVEEKWSAKYKRSINCSNPKGFSQKAHCAGRKKSEDQHPNDRPLGPEFKPTMPHGTVKVDVSDVYDWYKLGKYIADLDNANKDEFGKGPPNTILSFGSEEEEHKYIQALAKLGLDITDVDPKAHKKIKGIKKDPRFNTESNVGENFADGKRKGKSRPGRVKRAGASCKGSVTSLRKRAKNSSGEKAKMYHWCANMKGGKK